MGMLYMFSHSRGQEVTGEEVTSMRHSVIEVKDSERGSGEQTALLQSKWWDEGGKGQEVLTSVDIQPSVWSLLTGSMTTCGLWVCVYLLVAGFPTV